MKEITPPISPSVAPPKALPQLLPEMPPRASAHAAVREIFGMTASEGSPARMRTAHRHNELELNLIESGWVVYWFGGRRLMLEAGTLAVFWAAAPHQLVDSAPDTRMSWLTLPLQWFLRRPWPETFRRTILNGEPVCHRAGLPYDAAQFAQWQTDLASGAPEAAQCMLLEAEARLRRLAVHLPAMQEPHGDAPTLTHSQAECMAAYLTDHFTETLLVETVAAAAGLHPNYAMTVFRKAYGMTIGEYLTQVRIAYAQQLLVTTDQKVLNIALQAGFGSSSQFYVAFKRLCGQSPHEFRASLR